VEPTPICAPAAVPKDSRPIASSPHRSCAPRAPPPLPPARNRFAVRPIARSPSPHASPRHRSGAPGGRRGSPALAPRPRRSAASQPAAGTLCSSPAAMSERRAVPSSSEEYSKAIARVAVAQLAERERFSAMQVRRPPTADHAAPAGPSPSRAQPTPFPPLHAQDSAVDVLSDILIRFITEIGQSAHSYAEVAGRSEFNIVDVLLSLDDLGQPLDELQAYVRSLVSGARSGRRWRRRSQRRWRGWPASAGRVRGRGGCARALRGPWAPGPLLELLARLLVRPAARPHPPARPVCRWTTGWSLRTLCPCTPSSRSPSTSPSPLTRRASRRRRTYPPGCLPSPISTPTGARRCSRGGRTTRSSSGRCAPRRRGRRARGGGPGSGAVRARAELLGRRATRPAARPPPCRWWPRPSIARRAR
jgi:hypothetical protein